MKDTAPVGRVTSPADDCGEFACVVGDLQAVHDYVRDLISDASMQCPCPRCSAWRLALAKFREWEDFIRQCDYRGWHLGVAFTEAPMHFAQEGERIGSDGEIGQRIGVVD